MEPGKIINADFLDILFEGKNKAYGAYELRKTYNKRVVMAVTGMATICLLFFLTRILANSHDTGLKPITLTELTLEAMKPKEELPEPPQVKPPKAIPQQVAVRQYTAPLIVKEDVEELIPETEELEHIQIGLNNQDGIKDDGFVAPPVEQSTGVVELPGKPEVDYDKPFVKVEKEARFPGGLEGWKKYLERNLNANVAGDDGAPIGRYAVTVRFIVDKEGSISNVEAIEVPKACPDCGAEAVKVIKNGPKWEPAVQNDRKVIYQALQVINFEVAEQ